MKSGLQMSVYVWYQIYSHMCGIAYIIICVVVYVWYCIYYHMCGSICVVSHILSYVW